MAPRVVFLFFISCLGVNGKSLLKLSCEDIRGFVDGHNARRLQVARGGVGGQPAASHMNYMAWDGELAAKAGRWALQNNNYHNPDTTVGSGRFTTGENLYWYSTTKRNYKLAADKALASWFSEHKDYKFAPLKQSDFKPNGADIGHYTQMVWANSTHVGCAILQNQTRNWNKFYVVCNYGPAGNYIGQTPYKPGPGAAALACAAGDCSRPYGDKC